MNFKDCHRVVQLHVASIAASAGPVNPGLNCTSITKYVMNIPIICKKKAISAYSAKVLS